MFRHIIDDELALALREEQHAEELFALIDRNRAYLREWLPFLDNVKSVEDGRNFIRSSLEAFARRSGVALDIWFQGRLVGGIGLNQIDWYNKSAEIGYWIGEDCQGKGLVTRACRALLDYAFDDLGLNRVVIRAATGNLKSRAIPERLGFTREGIERQAHWLYDRFIDMVVYSMLADEWRNLKEKHGG